MGEVRSNPLSGMDFEKAIGFDRNARCKMADSIAGFVVSVETMIG